MTPSSTARTPSRSPERGRGGHLAIRGLSKSFYGLKALDQVSFELTPGELVGLIGPNGSGKTTAIDCITGQLRPDEGRVSLDGEDITRLSPHRLARMGVMRTFQTVRTFSTLSVLENILVGAYQIRQRATPEDAVFLEEADGLIDRLGLSGVRDAPAGSLSYGQRKLLEFAAAGICAPGVILLDEPVAAVNPTVIQTMKNLVLDFNTAGVTVLIVEHNMDFVLGLCKRLVVLDQGVKIADGPAQEVINQSDVQEAYFGR